MQCNNAALLANKIGFSYGGVMIPNVLKNAPLQNLNKISQFLDTPVSVLNWYRSYRNNRDAVRQQVIKELFESNQHQLVENMKSWVRNGQIKNAHEPDFIECCKQMFTPDHCAEVLSELLEQKIKSNALASSLVRVCRTLGGDEYGINRLLRALRNLRSSNKAAISTIIQYGLCQPSKTNVDVLYRLCFVPEYAFRRELSEEAYSGLRKLVLHNSELRDYLKERLENDLKDPDTSLGNDKRRMLKLL